MPDDEMLDALRSAAANFLQYLGADGVRVDEGVDAIAGAVLLDGIRLEA